jgi:two-component system, OmpR family, alkaline phosphatase synthesis response regulator PhoP
MSQTSSESHVSNGEKPQAAPSAGQPVTPAVSPAEEAAESSRLAASRILVIDDNPQNLEVLVAYLETLGGQVRTAHCGAEGLDKVRAEPPDLVLLDVMMPNMSGFEVCRRLKSDPATRDIPVLMVTALKEMNDIELGVQSGTDDFISKPVNRLELLTRVRSLLRVRHLKDELERTLAYLSDVETRSASRVTSH